MKKFVIINFSTSFYVFIQQPFGDSLTIYRLVTFFNASTFNGSSNACHFCCPICTSKRTNDLLNHNTAPIHKCSQIRLDYNCNHYGRNGVSFDKIFTVTPHYRFYQQSPLFCFWLWQLAVFPSAFLKKLAVIFPFFCLPVTAFAA